MRSFYASGNGLRTMLGGVHYLQGFTSLCYVNYNINYIFQDNTIERFG